MTSSSQPPSTLTICKYNGQDRSEVALEATHVDVSGSLVELPANALNDLSLLVQVRLPQGLRVIGESAFTFCPSLQIVEFPDSLQEIRAHAFEYCTNLSSSDDNSKVLDLSEGITVIGDQAFSMSCQSVEYIQLPSTLKILGKGSFSHLSALVSVGLHEKGKLETIGDYAFYGAHALRNVAIPSSVTYVGRWAFGKCHQLQNAVNGKMFDSCDDEAMEETLRNRFKGLWLHKSIYFDDGAAAMELSEIATSGVSTENETKRDRLDMTPLDILMLAPKPNYDLVPVLVQQFPVTVSAPNGNKCPAHYACARKAPVSVVETLIRAQMEAISEKHSQGAAMPPYWTSLIARAHQSDAIDILQLLIGLRFSGHFHSWRLDRWKQDTEDSICRLSSFPNKEDRTERLVHVEAIHEKAEIYQRMEILSNLELAVWKSSIQHTELENKTSVAATHVNREHCRIYSGSDSILSNVIPFLDEVTRPKSQNYSPAPCSY
ncbi:unnamed protein product [Cylindrotheca closterium]|uniref:Uncharacterized protein n=1 Tax=Cylindrotheca closterium TaxID=2856 RepID=A0AAD2G4J8_9STRA|nr:unnamed protein product [Cylindrotheca closterium]